MQVRSPDCSVSVRPDCAAADRVGLIVSALDSGHYGVMGGSAHEAALDGRGEAVDLSSDDGTGCVYEL